MRENRATLPVQRPAARHILSRMNQYRGPAGDLVVIGVNDSILAMRPEDGAIVWRHDFHSSWFGESDRPNVAVSVAFLGRQLFAATSRKLVCFDYATGKILSSSDLGSRHVPATLYTNGDRLYVYTDDTVVCFASTGQLLWQKPHGNAHVTGARPTFGTPGNVQPGDAR